MAEGRVEYRANLSWCGHDLGVRLKIQIKVS